MFYFLMPKLYVYIGTGILVLFFFYIISDTLAASSTENLLMSASTSNDFEKSHRKRLHSLFQHYIRPRRKITKNAFIINDVNGNPVLAMKKKASSAVHAPQYINLQQFQNHFNAPSQQLLRPVAVDIQQPNLTLYYLPLIAARENSDQDENELENEMFLNDNYELIPLSPFKNPESRARSLNAGSRLHDVTIESIYPSSALNTSNTTSSYASTNSSLISTTSSVMSTKSSVNTIDKNAFTEFSSFRTVESLKSNDRSASNKSVNTEVTLSRIENNFALENFTSVLNSVMSLLSSVGHMLSNANDNNMDSLPQIRPLHNTVHNISFKNDSVAVASNNKISTTKIQKHDVFNEEECNTTTYIENEATTVTYSYESDRSASSESVIGKILESIEAIRSEPNMLGKEELPCDISGFWSSLAGGMLLNITTYGNILQINLAQKTPRSTKGFLLDTQWNLKGLIPFYPKETLVIVTGINEKDKHVATFIGECRVCNGGEMVTGNWLLGRISRDCKDQRASQELLSDIWRRERLTTLRSERLRSIQERRAIRKKSLKRSKGNI